MTTTKYKEGIEQIQSIIDEKKENINSEAYRKLCDYLQKEYDQKTKIWVKAYYTKIKIKSKGENGITEKKKTFIAHISPHLYKFIKDKIYEGNNSIGAKDLLSYINNTIHICSLKNEECLITCHGYLDFCRFSSCNIYSWLGGSEDDIKYYSLNKIEEYIDSD